MTRIAFLGRLFAIPQTVLVALVGAVSILLVTVLASRVAVVMHRPVEARLVERLGDVYLDGLAAVVAPHLASGRMDRLAAALERVTAYHDGVREVRVMVRDDTGQVLGEVVDDELAARSAPPPLDTDVPLDIEAQRNRRWLQRPLVLEDGRRFIMSSQLDLTPIREERLTANLLSLGVNLALAVALAGAGFVLMRRLLAPLDLFERALGRAALGEPQPIPLVDGRINRRIRRLVRAYNRMARALAERRQTQIAHAEHLRAADLGRLAATIAHEVRNPLAGMLNAVDTARRFPDNRAVVAQSHDLLQRGLEAIARVVDTTLSLHRPPARGLDLRQVDLDDLEGLIRPVATRQEVTLEWRNGLVEPVPLDSTLVRQVVLNLALNAVDATPSGGRVAVEVEEDPAGFRLTVRDEGPGLGPDATQRLQELDLDWIDTTAGGIGLGVVIRAVAGLGGRIEAHRPPTGGTAITVRLPVDRGETMIVAVGETAA